VSKHLKHSYDPAAQCLRWEQFLLEIFEGNMGLINYLQASLGYSLTGLTTGQCFYLLYGEGANGKSTLFRAVCNVFGDYGCTTGRETFELRRESAHTQGILRLQGYRHVTCSELPSGKRLDTDRIKELTGGDATSARRMREGDEEFTPTFKLWFFSNHLPIIVDPTEGLWRKLKPFPLKKQFPVTTDGLLDAALAAEAPGILRWMVDGSKVWLSGPIPEPQEMLDFVRDYQKDSDPTNDFVRECCAIGPALSSEMTRLYGAYQGWAQHRGMHSKEIMFMHRFAREMKRRFKKTIDHITKRSVCLGVCVASDVVHQPAQNSTPSGQQVVTF